MLHSCFPINRPDFYNIFFCNIESIYRIHDLLDTLSTPSIPFSHYSNNVIKTLIHVGFLLLLFFFFFLSKFEICFVRPTFEGVDSLAVLLSSVWMRHPLGGTRFRVGGRLIPVFGQTDRERESNDRGGSDTPQLGNATRLPSYFIKLAW